MDQESILRTILRYIKLIKDFTKQNRATLFIIGGPVVLYLFLSIILCKFSFSDLILLITAEAIFWYTYETRKLRTETEKLRILSQEQTENLRKTSWGNLILELNRDIFHERPQCKIIRVMGDGGKILVKNGGQFSEED